MFFICLFYLYFRLIFYLFSRNLSPNQKLSKVCYCMQIRTHNITNYKGWCKLYKCITYKRHRKCFTQKFFCQITFICYLTFNYFLLLKISQIDGQKLTLSEIQFSQYRVLVGLTENLDRPNTLFFTFVQRTVNFFRYFKYPKSGSLIQFKNSKKCLANRFGKSKEHFVETKNQQIYIFSIQTNLQFRLFSSALQIRDVGIIHIERNVCTPRLSNSTKKFLQNQFEIKQ
eukprot:TRINITY_DN10662_c0_g1_i1.p1 TRINITY_DN10662_c0_g1~~TRINITY_DN10662_c0_g1_i1.p1  ORF type:complete len:228 (-),score=-16.44 TRINITY_DN10662_c0_g1_i1:103-786(-)